MTCDLLTLADTNLACTADENTVSSGWSADERLLAAMRSGDREALAEFIRAHESELLVRIRTKLPQKARRLVDAEDILATITRRLDGVIRREELKAVSVTQFWGLIQTVMQRVVIDTARSSTRMEKAERGLFLAQREEASAPAIDLSDTGTINIRELYENLQSDNDRFVFNAWLKGVPWNVAADQANISPECMRKRWEGVRKQLKRSIEAKAA